MASTRRRRSPSSSSETRKLKGRISGRATGIVAALASPSDLIVATDMGYLLLNWPGMTIKLRTARWSERDALPNASRLPSKENKLYVELGFDVECGVGIRASGMSESTCDAD